MTKLYNDQAVVLRTYRLGEADRIVVLMTRAHGKVRAVAKGVRKTKSRFGGRLEVTSHVALMLHEGRELDIITQAETIDHFKAVREELERFTRASAMLEAVDQVAQEKEPNSALYTMLVGALRTLSANAAPLIVPGFFLKLLALEGFRPNVETCVHCEEDLALIAYDVEEGGLLCANHRRGTPVSDETVRLLRLVLGGQLGAALAEPESPAVQQVDYLATRSIEHLIERRLKSVTLLDLG